MRVTLPMFDSAPDVIAADASAGIWTQAENVQFRAGMAERVAPTKHLYDAGEPLGPYLACLSIQNAEGEFYWLVATIAGLFCVGASGWEDVTPAGWAAGGNSIVTMHGFNGVAIVNDSLSGPYYWSVDPGAVAKPLPGWPAGWRVVSMRSHAGFLFGIGRLDMGGMQRVVWSDAAEAGSLPGSWQPAADNFAGWVDLLPAVSPCVDGISLGNEMLVFKGDSVHAFTFTGGAEVFTVQLRFSSAGLASVNAFARGPSERILFAASHGDVMVTDGVSCQSVLVGKAQRAWYDQVEPSAFAAKIQGATLSRLGISLMAFTLKNAGVMTRALVYDWGTGAISWRDLQACRSIAEGRVIQDVSLNNWDNDPNEWQSDPTSWNNVLTAATGDDVVVGGLGIYLISDQSVIGDALTNASPVYLLKTAAGLGQVEGQLLIRRVWPRIRGSGSMRVRIGASVEAEGPVDWSDEVMFPVGQSAHVDLFKRGRFISIELRSFEDDFIQIGAIDVDAVASGVW